MIVLCIGVTLATVTDKQVSSNLVGLGVGAAAICTTALYQARLEAIGLSLLNSRTWLRVRLLNAGHSVMTQIFAPHVGDTSAFTRKESRT